jgi:parallel beta-helix repeat protein
MFCFLITASFVSIYFSERGEATGNEIYVDSAFYLTRDGTAENPWASIQEAINKADDGDTIYVFGGSYNETLTINKRLNLIGSIDDENTIICKIGRHKYTIEITADFVTLEGFNITDGGNHIISDIKGALIHVTSDNVIIQGNNITDCHNGWGIYSDSSNGNIINNNRIRQVETGVYVSYSDTTDLFNNNISNCDDTSVKFLYSDNNRLYNNLLNNSLYGVYARQCENINISNNVLNENQFYGIGLYQNSGSVIEYNIIESSGSEGIHLDSIDSRIIRNILNNNQIGINLYASGCEIRNNFVNNSASTGIYAYYGSENNLIYLNSFDSNNVNAKEKGNNQWHNESLGNYWDDYNEIDGDNNGIGDTPYAIPGGGQDKFPLGIFLQPPNKPSEESPEDGEDDIGLKPTLKVEVSDPDGDLLDVSFYDASDDSRIGIDYNVVSGGTASTTFTLGFNTTFAWYTIADDGKQENQSDIWFFVTKRCPPENNPPTANHGGPYKGEVDQPVVFDGSGSSDSDGEIDFYRWNFGDGTSEILAVSPSHSYPSEGTYEVVLTVIDNDGTSDRAITSVDVGASGTTQKPVAGAGGPYSGYAGTVIVFNGSSSYDPDSDGMITNYTWRFDDGTELYGVTPAWVCNTSGEYNVTLTVTDNIGFKDTTLTTITISSPTSDGTPGFELIFSLIAITFILIWKRRRYC